MQTDHNTPPEMDDHKDQREKDFVDLTLADHVHEQLPENLSDAAEKLDDSNKQQKTDDPANLTISKNSASRLMNNGGIRFAILGAGIGVLVLGYTGYKIFTPAEEPNFKTPSEVAVPRSHAEASALSSPEQAEHLRNIQNQKADQADKDGETFVAGFITEADPNSLKSEDEGVAPTQPGANSAEATRMFFDAQGRKYTKEEALALYQSGQNIPGVTHGAGSISDANLNSTTATPQASAGKNKKNQPEQPAFQPYMIEPYTPKAAGNSTVDRSSTANVSLDNAAQNTDTWATDYLTLRQKKAQLVDEKTQYAFEEQITKLTEQMKLSGQKGKVLNYQHIAYSQSAVVADSNVSANTTVAPKELKKEKVLIYAGQQSRAILKSQVNSDHGLEIMATIVNGPLKNATVVGTATVSEDNMRFTFNKVLRQGKDEMQVSASGREIGTNALGMADEVKKHYMKRIGSLAAAGILSGVGEAYEQTAGVAAQVTGTAVVTTASDPTKDRIAGNVIGEVGDMLSGEFKKSVNRKPTVIAHSGKVFNLFFNQNVYDTPNGMPSKN